MTPQEAYNKGLDDAEAAMIVVLDQLIRNEYGAKFNNPELEKRRKALRIQLKWTHELAGKKRSNVGKFALEEIKKSLDLLK
jgi:hypothetical protein